MGTRLAFVFLLLPSLVRASEPWADPGLKTTKGLILWLDAARQAQAWKAHAKPPLVSGAALDVFYDASGLKHHLTQRVAASQPRFLAKDGRALIRFDGKDDFLGASTFNRRLDDFTLFLIVLPRSNTGAFRGFFAFHELGKNDYTTGLNVDMSHIPTGDLSVINVEGRGFGGAVNLMTKPKPFGKATVIELRADPSLLALTVDGVRQGSRKRGKEPLSLDAVCLGARCYSNSKDPPFVQGFFEGDIAEVLLYDRALSDDEAGRVRTRLLKTAGQINEVAARDFPPDKVHAGHLLKPVADPPAVQMLVPGFSVHSLPLDLPNINNVRYRHDGKLVALGYNGNIWLLVDTDGDDIEDRANLFWENKTGIVSPIGMAVTPPKYKHGQGVFIACKGKVTLIVDTDGDDKADKEIIVATGWKQLAHSVDALGLTLDKDGNIYFGLGTTDYANAYLKDKDGKAHFNIKSDRGTIQKVSADFRVRETVCSGVRFSIGMAFNREGDLFCTDQEGATWLSNGNPFDELLHIQPGKHYGFPPRHPKWLPDVIDEPSVFDYGPQHQSTCGLVFNDPVNGGPVFGPDWWAGDALVCGESRGKIFRTKLVKTKHGYVAQNNVIACLQMLTVDCCVSPEGDLVVACHSGPPDWGTGPAGNGKLFKIRYVDRKAPQPVIAWAQGPREVRIAFDKPLDVEHLQLLNKNRIKIEYGRYVRPGDRFETLKPPYAVVQRHWATPRNYLDIHSVQVSPHRRTLILQAAPFPEATSYAVTLPWSRRKEKGGLSQHEAVDVAFDLSGVTASYESGGSSAWDGWLPHVDFAVSEALTALSAEHATFWSAYRKKGGNLTLKFALDLDHLLQPASQEGAEPDHRWPAESVRIKLTGDPPAFIRAPHGGETSVERKGVHFPVEVERGKRYATWLTYAGRPALNNEIVFEADVDKGKLRPLALSRFLVPFAPEKAGAIVVKREIPELHGGNWPRGKALFFGPKAQCSACHSVHGTGSKIGPDLSNLIHRDYDSVLRDVRFPSAAINPDHLAYTVLLDDGRIFTGTLRTKDADHLLIGVTEGKEVEIERKSIESMKPLSISIMPEGIDKKLSPEEMRDLLTFLLTEPLLPAVIPNPGAPPPRSRKEVEPFLKREPAQEKPRPLNIVLSTSKQDHGPGEHDYPLWQRRWHTLLSLAENVNVETAEGWPSPKQWEHADAIVFYSANPGWDADKGKTLDDFLKRGRGLVYLHFAINGGKAPDALAKRISYAWGPKSRFRHGPLELTFTDSDNPITRDFKKLSILDESYWQLTAAERPEAGIQVLATCVEEKKDRPLLWTRNYADGRIFVSILGHYTWTFDDPLFRVLLLRGIAWTAHEPVDRLLDLVPIGARME